MELYLDARDTELLIRTLERDLLELQREICHTDRTAFRAALQADEARLRTLLGLLKTPAAVGM